MCISKMSVLIIDDKEKLCKILAEDFSHVGCIADFALNSEMALYKLGESVIDVVLLDLKLGAESGLDLLKTIKELYPKIPVIMVTGYGTIKNAVEAVKLGAWDYIQKPVNFTKIYQTVTNAAKQNTLLDENSNLKSIISECVSSRIITGNSRMLELLDKLKKLACKKFPILITGESGTGKELIAEFIHSNSNRSHKKLYKINCAAIASNLLDNELFGHEKGAYTGANEVFKGMFERADGATLFLDEIGDMSLETQAKILRTLQNSEVRRLGGNKTVKIDVRFIAATNKDLPQMIGNGQFREDLYYRLNLAEVSIPPLRSRTGDIPLLIKSFLDGLNITNELLGVLSQYSWPGNVRELKNVISYMSAVTAESTISIKDLPNRLLPLITDKKVQDNTNPINELEEKIILETLESCKYNKKLTAEKLKMSRKTLYNKIEKYAIKV